MTEPLRLLWIILPVIPLVTGVLVMTCSYLFSRQWAFQIAAAGIAGLAASAIAATLLGLSVEGSHEIALMDSGFAIVFLYETEKLFFLWALMIPTLLSLLRLRTLSSPQMVMIFLFYLSGCTGLVVTGDIFNFFVFYELMIMGAYVLISIKGEYGASVKYMIFGAASSAIFLAGIVMLYSSGAYFSYSFIHELTGLSEINIAVAIFLFMGAFFVKGAFFPVSGWVAPCHSAANSLVSAFLASFTIFSSVLGLYYMVLLPAEAIGFTQVFSLLRGMAIATIIAGAFFLFGEDQFKRVIAASTVFSVGVVALLLSFRLYEPAFMYILVHGAYKSLLFYSYDDITQQGLRITIPLATVLLMIPVLFYTAGFSPAVTGSLKLDIPAGWYQWLKPLFIAAGGLVTAGFAKFPLGISGTLFSLPVLIAAGLLGAATVLLHHLGIPPAGSFVMELGVFFIAVPAGRLLYGRLPVLHRIDRRVFYRTLNQELLLILILLMVSWAVLFIIPVQTLR